MRHVACVRLGSKSSLGQFEGWQRVTAMYSDGTAGVSGRGPGAPQAVHLPPISSFDSLVKAAAATTQGASLSPSPRSAGVPLLGQQRPGQIAYYQRQAGVLAPTGYVSGPPAALPQLAPLCRSHLQSYQLLPKLKAVSSGAEAQNYRHPVHLHGCGCGHTHSQKHTSHDDKDLVSHVMSNESQRSSEDSNSSVSTTAALDSRLPRSNSTLDSPQDDFSAFPMIKQEDQKPVMERSQSSESSLSPSVTTPTSTSKVGKKQPRKKKQCPICGLFFSNLSTHKSTHLSPETRPFKCDICGRGFARSNDLIRHKKLHWKDDLNNKPMDSAEKLKCLHGMKGTYKCPYNSTLISLDMELKGKGMTTDDLPFETSNCHSTGVFSRCDTYKNHLKALHFEYPPGTKKKDRPFVAGHCKHCGKKFDNVEIWLNEHVGKECGYNYGS